MRLAQSEGIIARCPSCGTVAGIYVRGGGHTGDLVCVSCRENPQPMPGPRLVPSPRSPGRVSRRRAVGSQSSDKLRVPAVVNFPRETAPSRRASSSSPAVSRGLTHRIP